MFPIHPPRFTYRCKVSESRGAESSEGKFNWGGLAEPTSTREGIGS
jgi:hypothetical protein